MKFYCNGCWVTYTKICTNEIFLLYGIWPQINDIHSQIHCHMFALPLVELQFHIRSFGSLQHNIINHDE